MGRLVERDGELAVLAGAATAARAGQGSIVLVSGEAGVGKTSLVRAFGERVRDSVRLLLTACDDLSTGAAAEEPGGGAGRPWGGAWGGALWDAAREGRGPLAVALAAGGRAEVVFPALLEELAVRPPTVLVMDDVHWADEGTLDLLLYAARRLENLGAALVLTYRDGGGPLRRLLGALAGCPVRRVPLAPLSPAGVAALVAGSGRDPATVYRVTGGNPFLVVEWLASAQGLPASVVDVVLAGFHRLGAACRDALERLSVVSARVPLDLAAALLGQGPEVLAEAEAAGLVAVGPDGLGFRHELARRVVEQSLPQLRRRCLHRAVVSALRTLPEPDLARIVHHAALAGDVPTLLEVGPAAVREAAAAGAHRRALALLDAVLPHVDRLDPPGRAAVLDDHAAELAAVLRFADAVPVAREAARRHELAGDPTGHARSLLLLARHQFLAGATDEAETVARQAIRQLDELGLTADADEARRHLGTFLARTTAWPDPDGDPAATGDPTCGAGWGRTAAAGEEGVATGFGLRADGLAGQGRFGELEACVREGLAFTRSRGLRWQGYQLEAHRCVLSARRGDVGAAEEGLRELRARAPDPGILAGYCDPWLGRLAARRGDEAAGADLAAGWELAVRQRLVTGLAYAGLAYLEWAWLAGDQRTARAVAEVLLRAPLPDRVRAEVLCLLDRAGVAVEVFPGCPEPFAASLRGDRHAAARGWRELGDPYEAAVELGFTGEACHLLEALRVLDGLGAVATAGWVRDRLRRTGSRVPRGPRPRTRSNPAGLTDRQLTVLRLLRTGLTNAEIAARLVLSVRTVDHHVAAILGKLGVPSRRDAAATASALGL